MRDCVSELAHEVGALAWADAVHFAPHAPIDVAELGVDVLICSPYKFFGPHLGMAFGRAEMLERWRPVQGAAPPTTSRSAVASRRARSRTSCSPGFVAAVDYVGDVGWDPIRSHERALGEQFLGGLPDGGGSTASRRWKAACRRSRSRTPR